MKSRYAKLISIVVCAVIALGAVFLTPYVIHGSASENDIYLYYNDRAWTRSNHPAHVNERGVYYAPLTFFVQLDGVTARINDTLQTFVITNGEHYLSFDVVSNYAANEDKIRIPLQTYEYEGERYVPIDAVCFYLDLEFENAVSRKTGATVLRVTNGMEQYSFKELVERRHPSFYETSKATTKPPAVTTKPPAVTGDTTAVQKLEERDIYLTVKMVSGDHTDGILDILKEYGAKASFFVDADFCRDEMDSLIKIVSGGHSIAVNGTDKRIVGVDELYSEMDEVNKILSQTVKYKTRVRDVSYTNYIPRSVSGTFTQSGYTLWNDNISVSDSGRSASAASKAVIQGIWDNSVCSISFSENGKTAETLGYVLEFISANSDVCTLKTVETAANY